MANELQKITALVVGMIIARVLLPIPLLELFDFTSTNTAIQTLVQIAIPVVATIALMMIFMNKSREV